MPFIFAAFPSMPLHFRLWRRWLEYRRGPLVLDRDGHPWVTPAGRVFARAVAIHAARRMGVPRSVCRSQWRELALMKDLLRQGRLGGEWGCRCHEHESAEAGE